MSQGKVIIDSTKEVIFVGSLDDCNKLIESVKYIKTCGLNIALMYDYNFKDWLEDLVVKKT